MAKYQHHPRCSHWPRLLKLTFRWHQTAMLLLYRHGDHTAPYQRNVGLHRITTDQISGGPEIHWTKGQQVNVNNNTNDFNTIPLLIIEYDFEVLLTTLYKLCCSLVKAKDKIPLRWMLWKCLNINILITSLVMELGCCCLLLSLSDHLKFWPEVVAHTLNFERQPSPYCARSGLHLIPKKMDAVTKV